MIEESGRRLPARWDPPEDGEPTIPARKRDSFTACIKRRIQFTEKDREDHPAETYMEKMADKIIDVATSDDRGQMGAARTIASYTDGKPAQTINNIVKGVDRRVDPDMQRRLLEDPVYREHVLAAEERRSEIFTGGDPIDAIDVEFDEDGD